jgi:hypothetical protein
MWFLVVAVYCARVSARTKILIVLYLISRLIIIRAIDNIIYDLIISEV